jgi:hypothetical protein
VCPCARREAASEGDQFGHRRGVGRLAGCVRRQGEHPQRASHVDGGDLAGGRHQDPYGGLCRPGPELYGAPQLLDVGPQEPLIGQGAGGPQQTGGPVEPPGPPGGLPSGGQPLCPDLPVHGQFGGPFQRRGGSRVSTPRPEAPGGLLQLCRRGRVRAGHRPGTVPGQPIDVGPSLQRTGQGAVGGLPLARRRGLVDGRADEGMAEVQLLSTHAHQARPFCGVERPGVAAGRHGGRDDHGGALGVVRRRHQQQSAGGLGQPTHLVQERALEPVAHGQGGRQRVLAGQRGRGQHAGELDEGQWIPLGPCHQLGTDSRIELDAGCVTQQRARRLVVQAAQPELGQPGCLEALVGVIPGREQQGDPFTLEPARHEDERCGRGRVQPVRVVDETAHGSSGGLLGEQAQRCDGCEEAVLVAAGLQSEGRPQRARLRRGQPFQVVEQRAQQLVQPRERHFALGLHALGMEEPHVRATGHDVLEQRGLPDAGRTAQHQRGCGALGPRRGQHRVDDPAFRVAPAEHSDPA